MGWRSVRTPLGRQGPTKPLDIVVELDRGQKTAGKTQHWPTVKPKATWGVFTKKQGWRLWRRKAGAAAAHCGCIHLRSGNQCKRTCPARKETHPRCGSPNTQTMGTHHQQPPPPPPERQHGTGSKGGIEPPSQQVPNKNMTRKKRCHEGLEGAVGMGRPSNHQEGVDIPP